MVHSFRSCKCFLYIPIWLYSNRNRSVAYNNLSKLYIPIWLYSNTTNTKLTGFRTHFTFQSGYIQMKRIFCLNQRRSLYIPIWLYSNPYPIIPSIQAILNYIFCLPIYLQVQNDYLVYSLLLLIILLPLFYNNCRTLYIL